MMLQLQKQRWAEKEAPGPERGRKCLIETVNYIIPAAQWEVSLASIQGEQS